MADTEGLHPPFLAGGGACGTLIAARDWSRTPLGRIEDWPQALRTATAILLRSPVPMVMLWGKEGVMIYNDAYSVFAGGRHPELLGSEVREGWAEVADFNDNVMRVGLAGGTLKYRDQELTLRRHGRPEQVWMNLDYSPVPGDDGRPAGVLAVVIETTERVRAEAKLRQSEAELRLVTDALPVLVAYIDRDLRYRFVNRAYETWFGRPREEIVGLHLRELLGEEGFRALGGCLDRVLGGERASYEHRGHYPGLGTREIEASYIPRFAEDGSVQGFQVLIIDLTERRAAERKLREADERAAAEAAERGAILEQLAEGVIIADADGRIVFVNDAAERLHGMRMLGVAPDDYSRTYGLLTEDGRPHPPRELPLARAVLEGETVAEARWRIRRPDGSEVLASGSARPVTGPDGERSGAVLTIRDETERARTDAALRASEARLRAVIDAAPVGLVFADACGRITGGNAQVERLIGHPILPSEKVDDYRAWESYHPDGRRVEAREYPLARVLAGEERPELEVLYKRGDGRMAWIRFVAAAKRDGEGRIIGGVVASVDIDRERRATEELRRLNAELEARVAEALAERRVFAEIVERTDFAVQVLDPDYRFLAINAANADQYEAIYGVRPRVGDRLPDILPDDAAREEALAVWNRAFAGEEFGGQGEFGDPRLGRRWYEMRGRPLRDEEGRITAAYLIGYDVTERMREREKLAQTEEALRQAQKMEAVGQLTGGIAHDFNNLLGAVVGSLDLIRRRADDPARVKRYAEAGLEAAERGAKLTGQLLAFSRAQRIELKPLVVAELVEGMRGLLARTLGPMVRLSFELDEDRVPVLADATQLEMAVLNLAINARDAMPDGGDLRIETVIRPVGDDAELKPGEYVELSVADTGMGMPPEVVARAFDPFFTTKGVGKGTGLGLSQVYGIARQAGGTVRIESAPGQGTAVRILLPRTDAPLGGWHGDRGAADVSEPTGPATILVVDDDADMRRVLTESLDALGYRVIKAKGGPDALGKLEESDPDMAILDFAMPGMNGAELAHAIRKRRPDLPIIFASGYADTDAIQGALGPEAPVLRKPFRLDDLQAMVAGTLTADSRA